MFYLLLKTLTEKYYVILVDVLGMGGSSRPKFTINDADESDSYLTEWLENWRIAMDNMTGFILGGHSFGGFICGLYASKYH